MSKGCMICGGRGEVWVLGTDAETAPCPQCGVMLAAEYVPDPVEADDNGVLEMGFPPSGGARRLAFLGNLGRAYDAYVREHGTEPEALVVVLGGLKQAAEVQWFLEDETKGGATSMLALAQVAILGEIVSPQG